MRLIDADELVKFLKGCTMSNGTLINTNTMLSVIDKMPTAYDVEKVVAELEEEKEISCADFTKYVNEYNPCLDDEYDDFFHKGLERAIEVIRKGGVE